MKKKYTRENLIIMLFIMIIIVSQGIRQMLRKVSGRNFNTLIIPLFIAIIIIIIWTRKIKKLTSLSILMITALLVISYISVPYSKEKFFRGFITFILPLYLLFIDYSSLNKRYIIDKIIKIYNAFIVIAFSYLIVGITLGNLKIPTGGLIGHSLTAGWYYTTFIALNGVYCKYFKKKRDIFIVKDIIIFLVGTLLTSGRVSTTLGIMLSIIYVFNNCKSRITKYILLPIILGSFMLSPAFNNIILEKFRFASGYGDITNGRLLGIREMKFFSIYPQFILGNGIGYSNYITRYLFNTINFENPILMFCFDYGVLSTILLLIVTFIYPLFSFIKNKNIYLAINYMAVYLIPYLYNGIAETTGLFTVLIMFILIFNIMSLEKNKIQDNRLEGKRNGEDTKSDTLLLVWRSKKT